MNKTNEHTLYQRGAYGSNNVYQIWSEGCVITWLANGVKYTEFVACGKGGKTLAQQVKQRVDARVRSKLDSGFKASIEEANAFTNQLGLPLPMLAKKLKDVRNVKLTNCYVQPKLDGHRCLIINDCGTLIAYSRRGKVINTIDHILKEINIPEGCVLDGELYCHGQKLQTIASWAKRMQPNTLRLKHYAYDIYMPNERLNFADRLNLIKTLSFGENSLRLSTKKFKEGDDLTKIFNKAKSIGYEGLILRPEGGYYANKRCNDLIKVKSREDGEFEVIEIVPGRDGLGILVCKTPEGLIFKTVAPGDHSQKKYMLDNKHLYIGKFVTCEFSELTKDKIPFHCVAIRMRGDI